MFSQVDRSNRPHGGLGIGLHLVKRLVEMHGGARTAHSDGAGLGSRFTVRLPALPESVTIEPSRSRCPHRPSRECPAASSSLTTTPTTRSC
jgi:hypothetical protein